MNYDTSMQDRENSTPTSSTADGRKRQVKGRARPESRLKIQECRQPTRLSSEALTTPTALYQVDTKWEDHPGLRKILDVIEMLLEESGLESSNLFGFGSVVDSNNDGYRDKKVMSTPQLIKNSASKVWG
ncbi:hypothetical protein AAG906_014296 [Vitis piasezkii]